MTNTYIKVIAGIVVVAAVIGSYFYPQVTRVIVGGAVSPAGVTNSSKPFIGVAMAPVSLTATSTSILNPTGGSDRFVTDSFALCTGVTGVASTSALASWNVSAATTSTANAGLGANTNYVANLNISTSTWGTTGTIYAATSTGAGGNPYVSAIWPAGTYLTYSFNATNTAACMVGSNYFPL